jgi:hypothetical protein
MSDDFWNELLLGQQSKTASSLDSHLSGMNVDNSAMRLLTDDGRAAAGLALPASAGTRVKFVTNIGSVLSYPDPPSSETEGTVVMVRTAEGDLTSQGGMVFVKWDDGRFMAMDREHLRGASAHKMASSFVKRTSSLGDLTGFLAYGSSNELVHKATKDLWSFEQGDGGEFVISRLFAETGEPLKV